MTWEEFVIVYLFLCGIVGHWCLLVFVSSDKCGSVVWDALKYGKDYCVLCDGMIDMAH
jgi:hypothetical protein